MLALPLLLPLALSVGLLDQTATPASRPTGDAAPAASPKQLTLMAREIQTRVEALRGQKLRKPLKMGVKAKPRITEFIQERLREEYGPKKVEAEGRLLKLFGLLPDGMDYGAFLTRLLTEQVAGFYDHTRKELHIADWIPTIMQAPVLAHEIFHAVQDQEWGGGKLIDSKKYTHDAVLAHAALLEGDATVVMLMYSMAAGDAAPPDVPTFAINMVAASIPLQMSSPEYPVMASAPEYLKQSLVFPYQHGLLFLGALRTAGWSWADFRKLYADPPQSTEQILHPERFAPTRDVPSEVSLAPRAGFQRPWEGSAGEMHFRQVFLATESVERAGEAAAGWDGDWTVLETAGKSAVVASASTWDSDADARDFAETMRTAHGKRHPTRPVALEINATGTTVYLAISEDAPLARDTLAGLPARAKIVAR